MIKPHHSSSEDRVKRIKQPQSFKVAAAHYC